MTTKKLSPLVPLIFLHCGPHHLPWNCSVLLLCFHFHELVAYVQSWSCVSHSCDAHAEHLVYTLKHIDGNDNIRRVISHLTQWH